MRSTLWRASSRSRASTARLRVPAGVVERALVPMRDADLGSPARVRRPGMGGRARSDRSSLFSARGSCFSFVNLLLSKNWLGKLVRQIKSTYRRVMRLSSVGVKAIVLKEGTLLLVQQRWEDIWDLPGGLPHAGETLENAVRREVYEESGVHVHSLAEISVTYRTKAKLRNGWIVIFMANEWTQGGVPWSLEIKRRAFFKLEDLPSNMPFQTRAQMSELLITSRNITAT